MKAALREVLAEVDVDAATLRRDPKGRTWLPAAAQAWVRDDPECAAMLSDFVAGERELFGQADVGPDPFFTARVLDALPPPLRFTGLTPRGRAAVLAVFHVIAGAVAYGIFVWLTASPAGSTASTGVPDYAAAVADRAHDVLAGVAALGVDASAPWLTAFVLGVVALVAFVSSRFNTRPT